MAGAPILVVDDAPVNLKLMRLLLTHEGYEVRTAERAEDALLMLSSYRPELILADLQLPGMNGLEMTRRVKQNPQTKAIRVVALTACAMAGDRERALGAGCDDYISKPIDTAALAFRVRQLLAPDAGTPAKDEAQRPGEPAQAIFGSEIETLRRGFLHEGSEYCRQLLDSMKSGFDAARAAGQLHQWVGSAALLGHSEISLLVQRAEQLLREEPLVVPELREVVSDLLLSFSELSGDAFAPVPDYLAEAVAGKRVALVGFTAERADGMCTVLERVKARPLLFSEGDDPASEAIQNCDLVLFHVRRDTLQSRWVQADEPFHASIKLVFAGEQRDLVALATPVRSRAVDFIVGRSDTQEVLLRIAFAGSRHVVAAPAPAPAIATEAPPRPRMAAGSPRILLADHDHIVHTVVRMALQNHGMSCKAADNGLTALSLIRSEQPHVAILDVDIPGMDGYEVLAAIREEKIPTRVIVLTALGREKDILRAFNLGADDYVTKPFNPFELVARLKRFLL
ncbi:MAG: response regulator [Candidatus Sulfopaludibacter sp.]|nr:response regulator [Candidatus Sulfopaludibacter sp.]